MTAQAAAAHYTIDELIDIDHAQAAYRTLDTLISATIAHNARHLRTARQAATNGRDTLPAGLIGTNQARAAQLKARGGAWLTSADPIEAEVLAAALPELEEAIDDLAPRVFGEAELQRRLTAESALRARMRSGQPLGAR